MKKALFTVLLPGVLLLTSCERPSSPDFETQQAMDLPLVKSTTYRFLGQGSGAIIDTTSEDFNDLFVVGEDNLVTLSSEIDFEIGDFDDIIPSIDVEPTEVESEIGLLDVDDFSSEFESEVGVIESDAETLDDEEAEVGVFDVEFNGSGTADFQEVTGLDPALISAGDPITEPAAPVVVYIELDPADFQSAEIEEGGIRFVFQNNLGFNLADLSATLLSDYETTTESGNAVGSQLQLGSVAHGTTADDVIVFDPGDVVEVPLALEVEIDWNSQNMQTSPGDLEVTASDEDLKVRNATANIQAQTLDPTTEDLVISNPDFEYAIVSDEPEAGDNFQLEIVITNNTELPITNDTQTGMPAIEIFNSNGDVLDAKKAFENQDSPGAGSLGLGETAEVVIDLTGERLTRILSYELDIGTAGGTALTVDQNDSFLISSLTTELKFVEARSDIDPQSGIELEDEKDVEGDFVNAEVEEGELRLNISNESNIPLQIDILRFYNAEEFVAKNTGQYFAQGSDIGEIENVVIPAQSSVTEVVSLDGVGISNRIAYDGVASSPGTESAETVFSTDLILTELDGSVQLNSASSVLDPQDFSTSGDVEIAEDDFRLSSMDHYVEIASGMLRIGDIVNEIDLDIDTLIISFPNIRTDFDDSGTYAPADSLYFEFLGDNRIRRSTDQQAGQPEVEQSLENVRFYAPGNRVDYNIFAITENTRNAVGDDTVRTVRAENTFSATVDIEDLEIKTAFGDVQRRVELLNEDEGDDEIIDLFNDNEAEVTEFDDLEELSDRISGLTLSNPSFDLIYDTNLGVKGTVIAAIVGINKKGEEVFLTGKPGSDLEVEAGDDIGNLQSRGSQIDRSDMIKFDIEAVDNIGEVARSRVIRFDSESSNVSDFLSNLPTEIRFVGKVVANPDGDEGFIVDPVEFNTNMGIDIPINLSTEEGNPASIEDTVSSDLSDLPSPDDDTGLSEMVLYVSYDNGLPFSTGFELEFLDENNNVITSATGQPIETLGFNINAAQVDELSRFVTQPTSDVTEITLTGEQLDYLHKTRNIRLLGELATRRDDVSGEVKLRADDSITLKISASFKTSLRVN